MSETIAAVTRKELADLVGLTEERIRQLVHEGLPQVMRSGRSMYVPRDVVRWLRERDREKERAEASGDGMSEIVAKARKTAAEAELKELELAERRRESIPAEEFRTFCDGLVGGFASVASGRLQQFERDIVAAKTPAEARRLTEKMRTALMQGAQDYADTLDDTQEAA